MVFKTTFGQSQRWSLIRGTLGVENEEKNNLNLANKVFNRQDVLILGGRNSGSSQYIHPDFVLVSSLWPGGSGLEKPLFSLCNYWIC